MLLEQTLEKSLDCKDSKPVYPKGNQSWIFTGRTDAEAESSDILPTWYEEMTHCKRPWCWESLKAEGEGDNRGWDGWMASLTRWTWVWVDSESWWWTGGLGCCGPWGREESDPTEGLNWTECDNCVVFGANFQYFAHWSTNENLDEMTISMLPIPCPLLHLTESSSCSSFSKKIIIGSYYSDPCVRNTTHYAKYSCL